MGCVGSKPEADAPKKLAPEADAPKKLAPDEQAADGHAAKADAPASVEANGPPPPNPFEDASVLSIDCSRIEWLDNVEVGKDYEDEYADEPRIDDDQQVVTGFMLGPDGERAAKICFITKHDVDPTKGLPLSGPMATGKYVERFYNCETDEADSKKFEVGYVSIPRERLNVRSAMTVAMRFILTDNLANGAMLFYAGGAEGVPGFVITSMIDEDMDICCLEFNLQHTETGDGVCPDGKLPVGRAVSLAAAVDHTSQIRFFVDGVMVGEGMEYLEVERKKLKLNIFGDGDGDNGMKYGFVGHSTQNISEPSNACLLTLDICDGFAHPTVLEAHHMKTRELYPDGQPSMEEWEAEKANREKKWAEDKAERLAEKEEQWKEEAEQLAKRLNPGGTNLAPWELTEVPADHPFKSRAHDGLSLSIDCSRIEWLDNVEPKDEEFTDEEREKVITGFMLGPIGERQARICDITKHDVDPKQGLPLSGPTATGKYLYGSEKKVEFGVIEIPREAVSPDMSMVVAMRVKLTDDLPNDAGLFWAGDGWGNHFTIRGTAEGISFQVCPGNGNKWEDRVEVESKTKLPVGRAVSVVACLFYTGLLHLFVDGIFVGENNDYEWSRREENLKFFEDDEEEVKYWREIGYVGRWFRCDQTAPSNASLLSLDIFDGRLDICDDSEVTHHLAAQHHVKTRELYPDGHPSFEEWEAQKDAAFQEWSKNQTDSEEEEEEEAQEEEEEEAESDPLKEHLAGSKPFAPIPGHAITLPNMLSVDSSRIEWLDGVEPRDEEYTYTKHVECDELVTGFMLDPDGKPAAKICDITKHDVDPTEGLALSGPMATGKYQTLHDGGKIVEIGTLGIHPDRVTASSPAMTVAMRIKLTEAISDDVVLFHTGEGWGNHFTIKGSYDGMEMIVTPGNGDNPWGQGCHLVTESSKPPVGRAVSIVATTTAEGNMRLYIDGKLAGEHAGLSEVEGFEITERHVAYVGRWNRVDLAYPTNAALLTLDIYDGCADESEVDAHHAHTREMYPAGQPDDAPAEQPDDAPDGSDASSEHGSAVMGFGGDDDYGGEMEDFPEEQIKALDLAIERYLAKYGYEEDGEKLTLDDVLAKYPDPMSRSDFFLETLPDPDGDDTVKMMMMMEACREMGAEC